MWEVEYTDEFEDWWNLLDEDEQEDVDASVGLLIKKGPNLPFPYSSGITGSKHSHMRELRIQHKGQNLSRPLCLQPKANCNIVIGW